MSSDDSKTLVIFLSPHQFEMIFQITYQLPNLQESRLEALGFSQTDLDRLLAALRRIRDRAGESSRVRIDICEGNGEDVDLDEAGGGTAQAEIRVKLPHSLANRWNSLAELVISALSPRELFLRTGYDLSEIRSAIAELALTE